MHFTVESNEGRHKGTLYVGNYNNVALLNLDDREIFHLLMKQSNTGNTGKKESSEVNPDHLKRILLGALRRQGNNKITLNSAAEMLRKSQDIQQLVVSCQHVKEKLGSIIASCKDQISDSFLDILSEAVACEFVAISQIFSIPGLITHHCLFCHSREKGGGF